MTLRDDHVVGKLSGNLPKVVTIAALLLVDFAVGIGHLSFGALHANSAALVTALAGVGAVGVTLTRIEYGILVLPVVATAVPMAIGTGSSSPLVAALVFSVCLIVVCIGRMLVARDLALVSSPVNLPLFGFILVAILSTINSNAVREPMVAAPPTWSLIQMGGLSVFVASAGVLLVAMNSMREMHWIRWLVWTFLGLGAVSVAGYLGRSHQDLPGFAVGGLFSMWIIVLALGQALFNERLSMRWRAALLALAAAWFSRRFFFEVAWLSGWVPATVAILALSLLKSRRSFLVVLVIALALGAPRYDEIFNSEVSGADSEGNFVRLDLWQQNLEVTRDHLLMGTGVAGYALYYATYFPDQALSSHSNYVDVFAQTGLVGSFFFLWLLIALFRTGFGARRQWRSGFAAGFVNGTLSGMVGLVVAMALGDWFIPFAYNQTIAGFRYTAHSWVLLGVLAGMRHLKDTG